MSRIVALLPLLLAVAHQPAVANSHGSADALATTMPEPAMVNYTATLNGNSVSINTGSSATGTATVSVDRAAKTVALMLEVTGLSTESLWDQLVAAPIGPIHLHRYVNGDVTDNSQSVLALPFPFGPNYVETASGFRIESGALDYATAVTPIQGAVDFDAFVAALESGSIVLNIHTDAFNNGEINGVVLRAGGSPSQGMKPGTHNHDH